MSGAQPRGRGRARGRGRIVALIATAALLLSGCASIPEAPPWSPREAAAPTMQLSTAGSATDPTTDPAQPATTTDPTAAPAAAAAAGLDTRLLYNATDASPLAARWGEIPGDHPLTDLLRGRVATAIADHAALTGVPYVPAADAPTLGPEARGCVPGSTTRPAADLIADPVFTPPATGPSLTITCEILAAAGNMLVEALRITTAAGGQVTSDETTVYYAETSGAFITSSDTFLSDDGLRTLLTGLVQSLKARAGALNPAMTESLDDFPVDRLRTVFENFTLAADGALTVTVPDDFSTPELDLLPATRDPAVRPSPLVITVPPETTGSLLTEQGRQIQAVLASGAPLTLPAAPTRGQETVDCAFFACVALTFDDGPGEYTAGVLDELDARRAAATFFLQGYRTVQNPSVVRRMHDEGHEIGNHTWNHPDLTKLKDEEIKDQLDRASAAIRDASGDRPTTFRPPYGAVDERVLKQTNLPAILWTVDTNDWQLPDDATLLDRAVQQPGPGAIILMHDVHENTARMTPQVLDGLLGRGFTLVTVQQLLGGTLPAPHTTTSRG